MNRILRDLRRPAAHDAAKQALMTRIGDDDVTLAWAAGLVGAGAEWRLALHARPGASDVDVVTSWRSEAKADKAAAESEATAALLAKVAAANAAEENGDDDLGSRPPGV